MTSKRSSSQPGKEAHGLYMVEKYERVIEYLYPIAQNVPRQHGIFKELLIKQLFYVGEKLNDAIKANQLSRCYALDSALEQLRLYLRFMVSYKRKMITEHQLEVAQSLLAEVGGMLNAWIVKLRK